MSSSLRFPYSLPPRPPSSFPYNPRPSLVCFQLLLWSVFWVPRGTAVLPDVFHFCPLRSLISILDLCTREASLGSGSLLAQEAVFLWYMLLDVLMIVCFQNTRLRQELQHEECGVQETDGGWNGVARERTVGGEEEEKGRANVVGTEGR